MSSADNRAAMRLANLLFAGSWYGLFLLFVTFGIYVSGSLKSYIPIEKVPTLLSSSAGELMRRSNIPPDWGWLNLVNYGDFLTFPALLALLSLATIASLVLIPSLVRHKEWAHLTALLMLIALMCLAASGAL